MRRATLAIICVGLAVTVSLSWLVYSAASHNEKRLLRLKVAETGSVLQALVPGVETPLRSAAEITSAAGGAAREFADSIRPFIGTGKPFVAASLWRLGSGGPRIVTRLGGPLLLTRDPAAAPPLFARALKASGVAVTSYLSGSDRRLGYALTTAVPTTQFVVYAESPLPARRVDLPANGPFSDLRFELYLGRRVDPAHLLYGNAVRLSGRRSQITVPFGDTSLTLVGAAARPLAGRLGTSLWWIAALVGLAATAAGAAAAERLLRGRQRARRMAERLDVALGQQRDIASELQRALLPHDLPRPERMHISTRYSAGTVGVDLGGDWYDVVALADDAVFFTVGDVSGRGVRAGAVMARLQYAARALALRGDSPSAVLDTLSRLLAIGVDGHFATVLCGRLDVRAGRLELANAGHLPPVLVEYDSDGANGRLLATDPGVPIGVPPESSYGSTTFRLPPRGALLAYTDGLVERRGENIDEGLERLRALAVQLAGDPEGTLDAAFAARSTADDDSAAIQFDWGTADRRLSAPDGCDRRAHRGAPATPR